jgi:hypothetical protein
MQECFVPKKRPAVANLAISAVCNQRCPYCFAVDHYGAYRLDQGFLRTEDFGSRLDFLARSGIDQVRLMGGEPTLHPRFNELASQALAAGFKLAVFSNGLMPGDVLAFLAALPADRCTVLLNINEPAITGELNHQRRCAAIAHLGERAVLSFNIHRADCDFDFLLPIVVESGCQPAIRLGLAHPCLTGANRYLRLNQYSFVGRRIAEFAVRASARKVSLQFDCGFVPCMFAEDDRAALAHAGVRAEWHCAPIPDVDIEGRLIYCYPLSGLGSLPPGREGDAAAARSAFQAQVHSYRQAGIFKECAFCLFKRSGECPGGCLAATIRRFQQEPFSFVIPAQGVSA